MTLKLMDPKDLKDLQALEDLGGPGHNPNEAAKGEQSAVVSCCD